MDQEMRGKHCKTQLQKKKKKKESSNINNILQKLPWGPVEFSPEKFLLHNFEMLINL